MFSAFQIQLCIYVFVKLGNVTFQNCLHIVGSECHTSRDLKRSGSLLSEHQWAPSHAECCSWQLLLHFSTPCYPFMYINRKVVLFCLCIRSCWKCKIKKLCSWSYARNLWCTPLQSHCSSILGVLHSFPYWIWGSYYRLSHIWCTWALHESSFLAIWLDWSSSVAITCSICLCCLHIVPGCPVGYDPASANESNWVC